MEEIKKIILELEGNKSKFETKAFSLAQREQSLNEREAFIKDQFERAGIEYGKD